MKKIYLVLVLLVLMFSVYGSAVADSSQEYYRLKYQGILDAMKNQDAQHTAVWNSVNVPAVLNDNGWFIVPLKNRLVQYSGFPFSEDTVARYAATWAWDWGVRKEEVCKQTLIRDAQAKGKFPTENQFATCAVTVLQWTSAYADNCEAIRFSFDVPPPVFAVNQWSDSHYWRTTQFYHNGIW